MRYAAICIGFLLIGISMAIVLRYAFFEDSGIMSLTELLVFVALNVTGSSMFWRNV